MQLLTKKQREIIDYITEYQLAHKISPSFREIKEHFGFSSLGSVHNHIHALKKKGALTTKEHTPRSLFLTQERHAKNSTLPLIGNLRGGMPIELYSTSHPIHFPSDWIPKEEECFLLKIVGDDFIEEQIQHDDLILVVTRPPLAGETVIVLVDTHTAMIKKMFLEPPYLRLASSNPHVQSIILREEHATIQGVVLSLFRHYRAD